MEDDEQGINLRDWRDAVLRRWFLFVLIVPVTTAIGVIVAFSLPSVYASTARVLVESQAIPTQLAPTTVGTNASERLRVLEQRLTARANMLEVIDRLKLFANAPGMTATQKVNIMKANTSIASISSGSRRGPGIQSFSITFKSPNPAVAARVTNEFVTIILEQNIETRSARAQETKAFFQTEADQLAAQLMDLEGQISAYKRDNELALPSGVEFRRGELSRLQERMFERERKMLVLQDDRKTLVRTLEEGVSVDSIRDRLSPEERELQRLRRELAVKRAVFSDRHPQVKALLVQIEAIRSTMGPSENAADEGALIAEKEEEIKRQIVLIDRQIALLEKQQSDAVDRQLVLEQSIAKAPTVEMQLNGMERRQADLSARYQDTVAKLAVAETGEKLEVNRQAERFEVIEQAQVPERPISPNRRLIAAGGMGAGFAAAFALVILAELMNQSIRTVTDLERRLNLRPIVTIPYIRTEREVRRAVWRFRIVTLLLLVVVPLSLYLIDQYYLPLETILQRIIEKTGLIRAVDLIKARFGG